jgi:hypothetical protein
MQRFPLATAMQHNFTPQEAQCNVIHSVSQTCSTAIQFRHWYQTLAVFVLHLIATK